MFFSSRKINGKGKIVKTISFARLSVICRSSWDVMAWTACHLTCPTAANAMLRGFFLSSTRARIFWKLDMQN